VVSDKELSIYFKNTAKALENGSLEELNNVVADYSKLKDVNSENIDIVLCLVAEAYDISVRTLKMSNARGKVQTARNCCYLLLHLDLCLNLRYIGKRIFGKWPNSVARGINYYKRLDLKIKTDKEFNDVYENIRVKLKQKIK